MQITPLAIQHISWKFFLIFVICDFIFITVFYFFYPETKNKTVSVHGLPPLFLLSSQALVLTASL